MFHDRPPRGGQRPARRVAPTWLARRLRMLREEKGMSRCQLSRLAGVSAQTVGKIEGRGTDPSHSILVSLARVLGVSLLAFDPAFAAFEDVGPAPPADPPPADF